MAQLNLVVGDVDGNTSRIVAAAAAARDSLGADVVLVPELAVSGYPPEDLLFHSGMRLQVARSLERLKEEVRGITLIAGYPEYAGTHIYNSAAVIRDGAVIANHRKACLPNYRVFDEKRYFTPGTEATVVDLNGVKAGVLVCEDVWDAAPAHQARKAGAQMLLVINASPYEVDKQTQREQQVSRVRVGETGIPLVFSTSSAARMNWCSTAIPSSWMPRAMSLSVRRRLPRACTWWILPSSPPARSGRCRERSCRCNPRKKACTGRWCRAPATTWTSTAFPAWYWDCPEA